MTPPARLAALVAVALALGLAGCDRAVEPYVPGERVEPPDLARIFPEGAERSAEREQAEQGPEGTGPRGAPPMGAGGPPPAPGAPAVAGAEPPIRGRITLAPALEGRVPAGAILFLIARRGESGPPLAVQRVPDPKLPLEFAIGPDDRMIEQMPFAGPLTLSARLDADGNAMTRLPGDLQGAAPGSYEPGAGGVEIVIDQAL
jgi:cytochrome c-type biogenesis protein CcmH